MSVKQKVITYGTSCNFDNKKKNKKKNGKPLDCYKMQTSSGVPGLSHIIQLHKSLFQHLVHIEVLFFSMWQFLC